MNTFQLKPFDELSLKELYAILKLRAEVFVVEQNAPYVDPDEIDFHSDHLMKYSQGVLTAYSRLYEEEGVYKIGRVVVNPEFRRLGLGQEIMRKSVEVLQKRKDPKEIWIHAQYRLKEFYKALGFQEFGDIFLVDGIDHKKMRYVKT